MLWRFEGMLLTFNPILGKDVLHVHKKGMGLADKRKMMYAVLTMHHITEILWD